MNNNAQPFERFLMRGEGLVSTEPDLVVGLKHDGSAAGGDILYVRLAKHVAAVGPTRKLVGRRVQTALAHALEAPFDWRDCDTHYFGHGSESFHLKFTVSKDQKVYGKASRLTADQLNEVIAAIGDDPVLHVQPAKIAMIMQVVVNYSAWAWHTTDFHSRLGESWKRVVQHIMINRHPGYNHQVFDLFVPHRDRLLADPEWLGEFETAVRSALSLKI